MYFILLVLFRLLSKQTIRDVREYDKTNEKSFDNEMVTSKQMQGFFKGQKRVENGYKNGESSGYVPGVQNVFLEVTISLGCC